MLLDSLPDHAPLLIDAASSKTVTAGDVRERAALFGPYPRGLAALAVDQSLESLWWFHALLEAGVPVALLDAANAPEVVERLLATYSPDFVVDPGGDLVERLSSGAVAKETESPLRGAERIPGVWVADDFGAPPHRDLAVLLTTSGSTGSPRFVRLSRRNVLSNAAQIVKSLGIADEDRGLASLPLSYSFGMSVLTSHALVGSPVVLPRGTAVEESFWADVRDQGVTFIPGVPTTYVMFKRLGFTDRDLPALRALIQAGGALQVDLARYFHDVMAARGGEFFVMYGQTEASPRISCLPSALLPEKLGSAGVALEEGTLTVRDPEGAELAPGEVGEVFYTGPNVMMGYAESRRDLTEGDTFGDELPTGDLGRLDDDGFLFITGRSKRIAKLAGARVSLSEVEALAASLAEGEAEVAAVSTEDGVGLLITNLDDREVKRLQRSVARSLRVPSNLLRFEMADRIPLMSSGKPDYLAMADIFAGGRTRQGG